MPLVFLLLTLFLVFPVGPTYASQTKPKTTESSEKLDLSELLLANDLYKQLYSEKKNAIVETIKKIDRNIRNHDYRNIESDLSRVINAKLYRDVGLWLDGHYRLARAQRGYDQKHYVSTVTHAERGIDRFFQIKEESPDSPLAGNIVEPVVKLEALIAASFAKRKRKQDAFSYFERAFSRIKKEWRMSRIPYYVPFSFILQYVDLCKSQFSDSCKYWSGGILDSLPSHSREFKKLNASIPKKFQSQGNDKTFSRVYRWYPAETEDVVEYQKVIQLYFEGKYRSATRGFNQFLDDYGSSRLKQKALYWKARTLLKRRKKAKADEIFEQVINESPTNYYAILAADHFGINLTEKINPVIPKLKLIDESIKYWEKRSILRAVNFIKSGLDEFGKLELDHLRTRSTLPNEYLFAIASLANELSGFHRSFHFLIELYARKYEDLISPYGIRLSFPLAYQETIEKQASKLKVDPVLILSLIKQESAFEADAISRSEAVGLMQLRLFTAADVDSSVSLVDLGDPEKNVRVGTQYLGSLLKRFDENIVYALAAYNAGPSRLVRWKRSAKSGWDLAEFVEAIPYDETQKYVIAIIRNYFWYHYRLTGEAMPNLDYFWGKVKGWDPAKLKDEVSVRNLSVSQLEKNH